LNFLTLIVLIIGVAVMMVVFLSAVSYALGVHLNGRGGTVAFASDRDPCAQCNADRDWYMTLPYWQQTAITAWWWANRFHWAAKGCK
jgi:hypothetical protein